MKLKLAKFKNNKTTTPRFNTERLKDGETKRKYEETIRAKIAVVRRETTDNEDLDEIWESQRQAYTETAEEILGHRKHMNKPWIGAEAWRIIDQWRDIKVKLESIKSERLRNRFKQEYKQKDKEVKKAIREDKRKWMEDKAQTAQEAAENGRQKELYDITKQISGNTFRKNIHSQG